MQRAATSHNKPQRTTASHNKPQRATTNRNHPKRATTTHDEPQRPKRSNNEPQRPTTSHKEQQQATTTHNDPQLRHKMIKTHKKLHNLVYTLSPFNPLSARLLMKIVLMLVPQVRSACCCFLAPGTHTILVFRSYSVCGGSIWKRFCAHNITNLAVKRLKSKYKFAAKFFLCFFLFFTWKFRQKTKTKLSI